MASALQKLDFSADELAVRSSIAFFLFVPPGENARIVCGAGLELLAEEDLTDAVALLAASREEARRARETALVEVEGRAAYEGQQAFLAVAGRGRGPSCRSRVMRARRDRSPPWRAEIAWRRPRRGTHRLCRRCG